MKEVMPVLLIEPFLRKQIPVLLLYSTQAPQMDGNVERSSNGKNNSMVRIKYIIPLLFSLSEGGCRWHSKCRQAHLLVGKQQLYNPDINWYIMQVRKTCTYGERMRTSFYIHYLALYTCSVGPSANYFEIYNVSVNHL